METYELLDQTKVSSYPDNPRAKAREVTEKGVDTVKQLTQKLLAVTVFLLLWELVSQTGTLDPHFVPPPTTVFGALVSIVMSGVLLEHAIVSLQRSGWGYLAAILLGIPLGFAVGWFRTFDRYIDPLLQTFRQLPTMALFPVFIVLLGIGEISKIAIIAKAAVWVVLLCTISGVKTVDPLLIKSARSMGISKFDMFWKVVLPSAIPSVFTGLKLGGTSALIVLVSAEMLGATSGLGYLLTEYQLTFQIPEMYAVIVVMAILGLAVYYALSWLEKSVSHWKEELPEEAAT